MKINWEMVRGVKRWVFDGRVNGKRKRMYFDKKADAEAYLKLESQDTSSQQWWLALSHSERSEIMSAFNLSKDEGFSLMAAAQNQAKNEAGVSYLKRMTLQDAVGSMGRDKRCKTKDLDLKPSGYLGSMIMRGVGRNSITCVKSCLKQFMEYADGEKQCKSVLTPEVISGWLLANADNWSPEVRKQNRVRINTFCNWLIKQDVLATNPVDKVDKVLTDGFDPYVLTPDECGKILNMCAEKHPIALPLLTLNLFCGIRPSECRRLNTSSGRNSNFRWEDKEIVMQAHKSKTKMRRSVEMSDNCFAWLKLTEFSLPIKSATHHWDNFLSDAKKLLGYDKWPHDCLRHSYCSYALRKYESAGKVAMNAGHSEGTLYKHYLKAVTKAEAEAFWKIFPEETLKAAA
jgi:integrase